MPPPVRRCSFVAPPQANLYHLQLCSSVFSPFSFYYREESKVVRVGGSAPEARAAIFISLLPSASTLSSSYDLSFRLLHLLPAWSYDLHPSCLAELTIHPLSLSPPPRVSFFLRSHPLVPSHFRTRGSSTFGKRVPSNPVFPHLLILAAPPSATSSSRFPPNRSPFLFSLLFRRFGFAHRESCKFIPRNLTSKEPPKDLTVSGSLDSFDVRPFPNTIDLRAPVSTLLDRISKYP